MAFNNYSQHPLHRDGSCWTSSTIILALAINGKDAKHSFFLHKLINLIRVRFDNKKEAFLKYLTVEFQS
ncbi:hypothetical protein T12_8400 [Trichinella patagoniensis]|uniref:Uncharacterized protein n=1 Tax=Trichinella patagoniensis TaxID=990121 RepID=A0A0V1A2N1_9BILA|nr:hypothetical protein T12_8400 [Trichinella patagoniensis]